MNQKNQIYYTTAQVTDMVELSDQNVRKYVRMLEERGYEVAKDEHQRRLFSQNDVNVLNEMIRTSKTSGFTLELAADEIMKNVENIISENEVDHVDHSSTNDDILKALEKVLVKLDEMRQENIILRENVTHLVSRLEEYDARILEVGNEQKLISTQMEEIKEQTENQTVEESVTEEISATITDTADKDTKAETAQSEKEPETTVESDKTEITEAEAPVKEEPTETSSNIDMSKYEDPMEAIEVPEEKEESEEEKPEQQTPETPVEQPKKKGFFARLFGN